MKIRSLLKGISFSLMVSMSFLVSADKLVEDADPIRSVVGSAVAYEVLPKLAVSGKTGEYQNWTKQIHQTNASFVKVHFQDFNLLTGDSVQIVSPGGRVIETLTEMGPKSRINFWALSVKGDTAILRFKYRGTYDGRPPFKIDRIIAGNTGYQVAVREDESRGICEPNDMLDAACYLDDPKMAAGIKASGAMIFLDFGGAGEDALVCSGSNITANNAFMTNAHCIDDQLTCDDAEFVFNYRRTDCDPDSSITNDWVSYRCDELLVTSPPAAPFPTCASNPSELDMSLLSIVGDPASQFGYIELDTEPMTSGEDVYIVQHPNLHLIDPTYPVNSPQQVTVGGGTDVVVDGSTLRYSNTLDTFLGSSGSPVIRSSSNKIVALHRCGNTPQRCWNPEYRNNGALATVIAPLVAPYTCSQSLDLRYGEASNLIEVVGNGNGSIDPGESWRFTASAVNNTCALDTTNVEGLVILSPSVTEAITFDNDVLNFGPLQAGSSAQDELEFSVPSTASCGAAISFDLIKLQQSGGQFFEASTNALSTSLGSKPQSIVYSNNFDGGIGSWDVVNGGTGTGQFSTWADQTTRSSTLTQPYLIVDSEMQGAGSLMDESISSDPIDVSAFTNVALRFTHDFHFKGFDLTEEVGDVDVRSSATNDQWVTIKTYTGETTTGAELLDLTSYKANDLQVRFHYYNADDDYYWAVDNVIILGDDGYSCDVFELDSDGDGVTDSLDNCTLVANADQRDTNGDGYGNICDPDLNNDGVTNFADAAQWIPFFTMATNGDEDFDGDGSATFGDYAIIVNYVLNNFSPPGPSGIAP